MRNGTTSIGGISTNAPGTLAREIAAGSPGTGAVYWPHIYILQVRMRDIDRSRAADKEGTVITNQTVSPPNREPAGDRELADPTAGISIERQRNEEYFKLRRLILEHGLLDRQYSSYAIKLASAFALLLSSIAILVVFDSLWVQMANAALMAVAFAQFAFLGHDSGHRQVFRSVKRNDMLMMLAALVTGMAPSWWQDKHIKHHVSPNQIGHDGDIDISVFAFTRGQALESGGMARFFVRHQAFWFYPMLLLTSYSLLFAGISFLTRLKGVKYPVLEPIIVATAVAAYLALVFTFLPFWHGVLFIVVHRALTGLHLGSVFAPNHKGMPILAPGTRLDHLRQQVLTSRNVIPNLAVDYMYGGLNYQIEHHLFPNMPRNRLKDARPVIRAFCADHGVPYHETGFWRSNQEILSYLHAVSAPLRQNRRKPMSSLDRLAGGPPLLEQRPRYALF